MSLLWSLVAKKSWYVVRQEKRTIQASGGSTADGFFFDKNATVTDPDHLPGHSKVILGNMIRVWTISEIYLGCIGREQLVLVKKMSKCCAKIEVTKVMHFLIFAPIRALLRRFSPNRAQKWWKQVWYCLEWLYWGLEGDLGRLRERFRQKIP